MREFLNYLQIAIFGDPKKKAYDALRKAHADQARRTAEGEYHRLLLEFYMARINLLDPYQDAETAQHFADAMWPKEDHSNDLAVERMRLDKAAAKVLACQARYQALLAPPDHFA